MLQVMIDPLNKISTECCIKANIKNAKIMKINK